MAYEKNICGDCNFFSDTGECRIPQVKHPHRAFFSPACVWFEKRKEETEMETYKVNTKTEAQPKAEKPAKEDPKTKVCAECGEELPIEKFHRNRWGYTKICKKCHAKKTSERVAKTIAERRAEIHKKVFGDAPEAPAAEPELTDEIIVAVKKRLKDLDLVWELRERGWDVRCTKTIQRIVEI